MEPSEIHNSSMQNGLASSAMLAMAYLLIFPNVFHVLLIVPLAIWHETIHAFNLKVIRFPHLQTVQTISVRQRENVLPAAEVLHKPHKSSMEYSIASLQMKLRLTPMFELIQQSTPCLMAKITSSSCLMTK